MQWAIGEKSNHFFNLYFPLPHTTVVSVWWEGDTSNNNHIGMYFRAGAVVERSLTKLNIQRSNSGLSVQRLAG